MLKRSLYKSVDFNLSIYKLDLINAELEVFKIQKLYLSFNNNAQDIIDKKLQLALIYGGASRLDCRKYSKTRKFKLYSKNLLI
jgi:hypothetical protein